MEPLTLGDSSITGAETVHHLIPSATSVGWEVLGRQRLSLPGHHRPMHSSANIYQEHSGTAMEFKKVKRQIILKM